MRSIIDVEGYWKVIVYYDLDYNFSFKLTKDLKELKCKDSTIRRLIREINTESIKGCTISNSKLHKSVVVFVNHEDYYDYVNTIIHESEHIKQDMLYAYSVEDSGEEPAYTVGYISMILLKLLLL